MRSDNYFCNGCERFFAKEETRYETHGLDTPPYERYGVCPYCGSDNFCEFDAFTLKIDVAEDLLWVIMWLNKLGDGVCKIFGDESNCKYLSLSVSTLAEKIIETFYFIKVDMQKRILRLNDENELQRILLYLKGGL